MSHPCAVLTAAMADAITGRNDMVDDHKGFIGGEVPRCEYRASISSPLLTVSLTLIASGSEGFATTQREFKQSAEKGSSGATFQPVPTLGVPAFGYTLTGVDPTTWLDFMDGDVFVVLATVGQSATHPPYAVLEATAKTIIG